MAVCHTHRLLRAIHLTVTFLQIFLPNHYLNLKNNLLRLQGSLLPSALTGFGLTYLVRLVFVMDFLFFFRVQN